MTNRRSSGADPLLVVSDTRTWGNSASGVFHITGGLQYASG
ncbi:MAG: hypothetical protein ACJ71W_00065 [Terriglobales bacterium]